MSNLYYWLWFVMAFGPSNERIWEVIGAFNDIRKAYDFISDGKHPSLNEKEKKSILSTHIEQCDSIIKYCKDNGYRIITFEDENYPPMLCNIYNPPAVLFCMGNIENYLEHPSVTCVGTRKPDSYSIGVTERFCTEFALRDFAVVSGFALGIDSTAHSAVLNQNGCTVAVLASGIDVDYPRENAQFKKHIAVNGAVITEYLPGTRPNKFCFQYRNRIMSGLSFGTLITEASEQSGALITAKHAVEQGRSLFCIPPRDIFDKRYLGVVKFLRDGAVSAYTHFDILCDYYFSQNYADRDYSFNWPQLNGIDDIPYHDSRTVKKKSKRKPSAFVKNRTENTEEIHWEQLYDEMDDDQKSVIDCLKDGEKHPDEICAVTGMDSFLVMAIMTELEMTGAVEYLPTRKYRLI